jgi:SAM-dependent methyltransferase
MRLPKPTHLGPAYSAQFSDPSVARAYGFRPPYPDEVYAMLTRRIVDSPSLVLDLGCGLGEIARRLAAQVERVDAVDPSQAMLEIARTLADGERPNIHWHCCPAEEFLYGSGYDLVITAESLHWMAWERVLPAVHAALSPRGKLAIILGRRAVAVPWDEVLQPLVPVYSTNQDYQTYDLLTELAVRRLFHLEGHLTTPSVPFRQSVAAYIESWHSRNGFSRDRMGALRAVEFDERVHAIVTPYADAGLLQYDVQVELAWGIPSPADPDG